MLGRVDLIVNHLDPVSISERVVHANKGNDIVPLSARVPAELSYIGVDGSEKVEVQVLIFVGVEPGGVYGAVGD